jgi:hypothetical protein
MKSIGQSLSERIGRQARTRPASAKKRRNACLQVEPLEDRTVPTIVIKPYFGPETIAPGSTNDGMQHPNVVYIFSGSYWTTAQGQQDETALLNAAKAIMSGPYLSGLTQYGSDGKANFWTSWNDANTVPSPPSISDLLNFLDNSITSQGAVPGINDWQHAPIYVVVSDPVSSAGFNGGWNKQGIYMRLGWGLPQLPQAMHMIWVGTSTIASTGRVWKDAFTLTLSHELAETISDPDTNGIRVNPPSALPASMVDGSQIADNEPEDSGQGYGYRLNGNLVQPYWSAQDQAFIVPDYNFQKFYLTPNWSGTTFRGTYNLSIKGDQLGVNYADNIEIGGNGSNVSVSQNNEAALFDPGVINNVNVDTKGGANFVRVYSVPAGVTVNIDSTGASNDTVVIGSATDSLAGIQGTVNVSNSSGQTKLVVDDLNDHPRFVTITDHSVAFSGVPTINYQGGFLLGTLHGVTELDVIDGTGANVVDVLSVPSLTSVILDADTKDSIFGPAAGKVTVHKTHT